MRGKSPTNQNTLATTKQQPSTFNLKTATPTLILKKKVDKEGDMGLEQHEAGVFTINSAAAIRGRSLQVRQRWTAGV